MRTEISLNQTDYILIRAWALYVTICRHVKPKRRDNDKCNRRHAEQRVDCFAQLSFEFLANVSKVFVKETQIKEWNELSDDQIRAGIADIEIGEKEPPSIMLFI